MNTKKILKTVCLSAIAALALLSCAEPAQTLTENTTENIDMVYLDPSAPVIEFTTSDRNSDGEKEFYLFDDNPEHLNPKFLADGEIPSSIAHFEELEPGVYTVFSYHHRGTSVDDWAELFYDTAFSSEDGAKVEILNIGLDHDWDWNQAWADYTGTSVLMPEYLKTFQCTCGEDCGCTEENGICINPECPAIVRDEKRDPKTNEYDGIGQEREIPAGEPVLLSDIVTHIEKAELNHFRYGSYQEPMWLMMKFRVVSGTVTFDTLAYSDKNTALKSFASLENGAFDNEPQYKGIAYSSPVAEAEFGLTFTDDTPAGDIPVTVKNARNPEGITLTDGVWATNVNTWKEERPIAAESDMMRLEYKDDTKLSLYGGNVLERDNIWRFDPYHTKCYFSDDKLELYDIPTGGEFVPNSEMKNVRYPKGNEISGREFYAAAACNLGNFGVTNAYAIHIKNDSADTRKLSYEMKSIAGQVYRWRMKDGDGNIISDDGGSYYMKKFDDDPAEDPASDSEPKARLAAAEYSDTLTFDIPSGEERTVEIEITTLTGCNAPTHNKMSVK